MYLDLDELGSGDALASLAYKTDASCHQSICSWHLGRLDHPID